MPAYDFECSKGHRQEVFFKIADKPETVPCDKCGRHAKQIMSLGGIETDSPTWINNEVREALQDSDRVRRGLEPPIETRSQWSSRMRQLGVECVG